MNMDRICLLFCCLLLVGCSPSKDGWIELFNGENLEGWHVYGGGDSYEGWYVEMRYWYLTINYVQRVEMLI